MLKTKASNVPTIIYILESLVVPWKYIAQVGVRRIFPHEPSGGSLEFIGARSSRIYISRVWSKYCNFNQQFLSFLRQLSVLWLHGTITHGNSNEIKLNLNWPRNKLIHLLEEGAMSTFSVKKNVPVKYLQNLTRYDHIEFFCVTINKVLSTDASFFFQSVCTLKLRKNILFLL